MEIEKSVTVVAAFGEDNWQPVFRVGAISPLKMRRRTRNGEWIYREPTEAEICEYLSSEGCEPTRV